MILRRTISKAHDVSQSSLSDSRLLQGYPVVIALISIALSRPVRAEPIVEVVTQNAAAYGGGPTLEAEDESAPFIIPLHVKFGLDSGYDDNINASAAREGAWFTTETLTLSYDRADQQTQFHLLLGGGLRQFFNPAGTHDENGNVSLSLVHNFTPRLTLAADLSASYQVEPDFSTNVGPETVLANHFQTTDTCSLIYYWLPRVSARTNFTYRRIMYDDESIGIFQDRSETMFGEVIQLKRSSRTNFFAEYRYLVVDYDSARNDSTTNFVLAGLNHKLTQDFSFDVRGGATSRSFEQGGDRTDPYFEGSLEYGKLGRSSIKWTASYGVEEAGSTLTGIPLVNITLRTGLQLSYNLSPRITSMATVYYNHADTEGVNAPPAGLASSQGSFDCALSLRYAINQRFALHVDYNYSSVESTGLLGAVQRSASDYSRNRYFAGISFTY